MTATLAALSLSIFAASAARADQPFNFDTTPGHLSKNVIPLDYDIVLQPQSAARTTSGTEKIGLRVRAATPTIVLSTLEMSVSRASLDGAVATVATDETKQQTTLTFAHPVAAGLHSLRLAFAGKIGTAPQGLFVQPYTTSDGVKEEMLATQFESADARRMFPCFDEPAFRATYHLTATVPADFTAVSNMPVERERNTAAGKVVTFERTPKMSTYLVVLAAGRFKEISDSVDGVKLDVFAPHDRIDQATYALAAEKKLLAYYDDYFGYRFPLPKLDLIDVPGGFPGAMENWGGITFTESDLLFDPKLEPESAKVDIFETIAHEMSHQWTGDLVTMDWWSGLWLNEGFADWMETKASDHFNPQWHLWDRVEGDVATAMSSDQKATSHPIEQPVPDDTQAGATFDEITYQKGGAVIRMMEQYLGEDTFRDGVRAYLRAHAYGNTTSADLWASLGSVAHRDVGALVDPWIVAPGLPVVTATTSCANGHRTIALEQHRFLVDGGDAGTQLWPIPVGISTGGASAYTLLSGRTATVDGGACDAPLEVNSGALGYYRVGLDESATTAEIARLPQYSVAERARAIGDLNALMLAGTVPPARLFAALGEVRSDDALTVWGASLRALRGIADLENGGSGQPAFEAYSVRLLRPVLQRIGWNAAPNEDSQTESLRSDLIDALGTAGDRATIAEANARFARFNTDPSSLPPSLRGSVLGVAGSYADGATWEELRKHFLATKNPEEAQQYARALWAARDPELARKNLQMAVDGSIPAEFGDILPFIDIVDVAAAGRQRQLAWTFYQTHGKAMTAKLSAFVQPFVTGQIVPFFWNAAPETELDAVIDGAVGTPAQLKAKAKHDVSLRLAQRDRLVPPIDAFLASKRAAAR
ncbi:MAG: M1 family metallopeptidase [Candidatus Eremiobacteraeota bacterium]|nr:M1 family metallopeptidase [Candidatus Eremiobacteraeota bacterium]